MNGGCCTGAQALPPQDLVMSTFGTATAKRTPPTMDETREAKKQRHHYHLLQVALGKRKHEDDESDYAAWCRENDKMFKCNYWEDPAYAKRLQRNGLERARIAAQDNQIERLLKFLDFDDEPAPDAPRQPPEPAGTSAADSRWDRIRRFDLDYW